MQSNNESEGQLILSNYYQIEQSQNMINTSSQNNDVYISQFYTQANEQQTYNIADIAQPSIEKILDTLQNLYMKEQIYVDLGHNHLISLNPLKDAQHWNDQQIQDYKKNQQNNKNDQYTQSHLFKLAEKAKQACLSPNNTTKRSSIIIQGINGAGKTVASNGILKYIAAESKSVSSTSSVPSKVDIEKRMISTNIIFEAFGNARTSNNLNSSRFGKILQIQFNKKGKIKSGRIITTLFERIRVIQQGYMERNYHIFYQLFIAYQRIEELKAFAQQQKDHVNYGIVKLVEEIQKLKLDSDFAIFGIQNHIRLNLNNDLDFETKKQDNQDFENFKQLLLAFGYLNLSFEEILSIIQCVAGLIHLYEYDYDNAQELLQIPNLQEVINSQIKNSQKSKKIQLEFILKEIIMDFYYNLFYWIQGKINQNLSSEYDQNQLYTLNIFDSFGLEIIENQNGIQENQLEQLMLNYVNEKLQNSYYNNIIDDAEKLFKSENLDSIPILNNQKKNDNIIELFEKVIFNCLNVCYLQQSNNYALKEMITKQSLEKGFQNILIDQSQLRKQKENLTQNQIILKQEQNILGIRHTGSEIYYQIDSFLQRIKYPVSENLQDINKQSKNSIIKSFTLQSQNQTVVDDTQQFINDWISIFQSSDIFFVKCLQTNYQQKANYFDRNAIQIQLTQSGIEQSASFLYKSYLECIPKQQFLQTYQSIYPNIQNEEDLMEFINPNQNLEYIYFGSNNILIKDLIKRTLDYNIQQHLQALPYLETNYNFNLKIEEINANYNRSFKQLNKKLELTEKECELQREREDVLKKTNDQLMKLMQSNYDISVQQMTQILSKKESYMNIIQNLSQPKTHENQNQVNYFQFGHIQ